MYTLISLLTLYSSLLLSLILALIVITQFSLVGALECNWEAKR